MVHIVGRNNKPRNPKHDASVENIEWQKWTLFFIHSMYKKI